MNIERENSRGGMWIRWMLANAVGLAAAFGLFAFTQDILGGESGTLRHDIGSMVGLTIGGAVIGLFQSLAFRNNVKQYRSVNFGVSLLPIVVFIVVTCLGVVLSGGITAGYNQHKIAEEEILPTLLRIIALMALGVATALIMARTVLRNQFNLAGWGVFASSVAFPTGFILGFALGGPPVDFVLSVLLVGMVGGVMQWLVLREQINQARWWILASTLGMTVGAVIGVIVLFSTAEAVLGEAFLDTELGFVTAMTIFGGIAGAFGGFITGLVLARVLRNTEPGRLTATSPSQVDA